MPWSMVGAALAAFAAMYFTGERFAGLPVLAALLVLSRLIGWRMSPRSPLAWAIRIVAFTAIILIVGPPREDLKLWYIKPEYTNLLGYLLATEFVVRAWKEHLPAKQAETRGIAIVLTALVLTAGANTYDLVPIRICSPIYLAMIIPSLGWLLQRPPAGSLQFDPAKSPRLRFVALRALMLLAALSIGMSVSHLIHRYERNLADLFFNWPRRSDRDRPMLIGLANSPRLQNVLDPKPAMTRILRVDGSATARYLRVAAFDTLAGREWGPPVFDRRYHRIAAGKLRASQSGQRLRIIPLEDVDPLPLPLESAWIDMPQAMEIEPLGALRTERTAAGYTIVAGRDRFQGPLCLAPDDDQRRRLLAIPDEIDGGVIAMAKEIAGSGDAASRILRLQQHLRSSHGYSLSFRPEGDPMNDFILNRRAAHCQYFASALVIMARAANVPARLVTGYYAHEADGDEITVRQRDAHAWAEVWIDGTGWVTADATPTGGLPDALFGRPSAAARAWEWIKDLPRRFFAWLSRLGVSGVIVLIVVGLAILAIFWVRRYRRQRRKSAAVRAYSSPGVELDRIIHRFEQWLRRRGILCPRNITWREHVRASPDGPHKTESADCLGFLDAYDEARFGGEERGPAVARARSLLDALEEERPMLNRGRGRDAHDTS